MSIKFCEGLFFKFSMNRRRKIRFLGRLNIAGLNIKKYREALVPPCSQNELALKLQLAGLSVHKNMVSQVEKGEQGISDVELRTFAQVLGVTIEQLMDESVYQKEKNQKNITYPEDSYDVGLTSVADT